LAVQTGLIVVSENAVTYLGMEPAMAVVVTRKALANTPHRVSRWYRQGLNTVVVTERRK
jgi:hypothetical protein